MSDEKIDPGAKKLKTSEKSVTGGELPDTNAAQKKRREDTYGTGPLEDIMVLDNVFEGKKAFRASAIIVRDGGRATQARLKIPDGEGGKKEVELTNVGVNDQFRVI